MADSVRYLCANGGELGFPFTIDRTTVVPQTVFPIANPIPVPLTTAIKWWWRVKDWIISTDFQMTDSDGTVFNFPSVVMPNTNPSVVRELNLVAGSNYDVGASHVFQYVDANAQADLALMGGGAVVGFASPDYYPQLFVGAGLVSPTGDSVGLFSEITGTLGVVASLDSLSLNLKVIVHGNPLPLPTYSVSFLTVSPNSYWPYATLAVGLPIYDTSTGVQLEDPTS